jgi:hypothetical protein
VALYRWNAALAGALWEALGHTEVVLRNALHEALSARHHRLARPGQWYDDPANELETQAVEASGWFGLRAAKAGGDPPHVRSPREVLLSGSASGAARFDFVGNTLFGSRPGAAQESALEPFHPQQQAEQQRDQHQRSQQQSPPPNTPTDTD